MSAAGKESSSSSSSSSNNNNNNNSKNNNNISSSSNCNNHNNISSSSNCNNHNSSSKSSSKSSSNSSSNSSSSSSNSNSSSNNNRNSQKRFFLHPRTLCLSLCWVVCSALYYSLLLDQSDLSPDPYLGFLGACAVQVPGYVYVLLTLERPAFGGRRRSLCAMLLLSGAALVARPMLEVLTDLVSHIFTCGEAVRSWNCGSCSYSWGRAVTGRENERNIYKIRRLESL